MKTGNQRLVVLAGLLSLGLLPGLTQAAEALEDIVVTSGRVESTLQDEPVAVSAFDENEINRRQTFNVVDVVNNVPNLVGNNNIGQGTATTVFLRGVGTTESIVTIDTAMGFYVDDVYIARQGVNNFSLFDVERVEVLRGPQGTLYGRNTSAGALNVITRKPQENFEAGGEVAAGEFDRVNVKGFVNVPLVEDKLLFRLNAGVQQGDGYTNNDVLGKDVNDRDFWGLRGSLLWQASDNVDVMLTADVSRSDENGSVCINLLRDPAPDLFDSISGTDTSNKGETDGVALTVDWGVSDALNIQSITSVRNTFQQWNLDLSDAPTPATFILYTINDSDQVTQEFKFTGDLLNDRLHYVGGLFYFNEDSFSFIGDYFEAFPGVANNREYDVETESYAVYANLTFDLTDSLSLIAGGRYTEDDKSLKMDARTGGTPGFTLNGAPNYIIDDKQKFDEFTPRLGITYSFTDDLQTYFTYQKGFKSGGWSARTSEESEVQRFGPETNDSFALGMKWLTWDGRARINVEGFFYDYQNFFNSGTGAGGNFLVATNDAEIKGIELETTVRITDNFDVFGFLAVQDGEYKNVDPNADFVGSELQRLPELNYKIGGTYRWPLGLRRADRQCQLPVYRGSFHQPAEH